MLSTAGLVDLLLMENGKGQSRCVIRDSVGHVRLHRKMPVSKHRLTWLILGNPVVGWNCGAQSGSEDGKLAVLVWDSGA